MTVKFSNNATSRLTTSITTGSTTISVQTGDGLKFPVLNGDGDWFPITIVAANGVREICKCTSRSGDMLTVERAQEGTAASSFSAGDRVELRLTAGAMGGLVADKIDISSPLLRWLGVPIGSPLPIFDHIPTVETPPTDNPLFRFIKLTAADDYNAGLLTNETVSGSGNTLAAYATVSLPGSPLNNRSVRLINTERRFIGAGESGLVENGQVISHAHGGTVAGNGTHTHTGSTSTNGDHNHSVNMPVRDSAQRVRIDPETSQPVWVRPAEWGDFLTTWSGNHTHSLNINGAGFHTHTLTINPTGGDENLVKNQRATYYLRIL